MANLTSLDTAELATQTMLVPLYGSSATSVTPQQAAANRSIYGVATPAEVIASLRPGGVLLLERIPFHPQYGDLPLGSLGDSERLTEFTASIQETARREGLPTLLIIADQEGGRVNRLPVSSLPAAAVIGATGDTDLARRAGRLTAEAAIRHGVNVVFGPVADIGISDGSRNSAIGDRSFGSDPALVADLVAATIDGIREVGVGATAKHWPGHGRATADSHVELPSLPIELTDWRTNEERPFRAAIDIGVDAVLAAHLTMRALDPSGTPASVSAPIIEYLRSTLGFEGVVISNALWMPGIRNSDRTDAETGLAVLEAGADCLLAPPDPTATRDLIVGRPDLRPKLEEVLRRLTALRSRLAVDPDWSSSVPDWEANAETLREDIDRARSC